MAIVRFESRDDCDLVEVQFVSSHGSLSDVRLLVDSGFTGASSFVLSDKLRKLALANLSSAHAAGALMGRQPRVLVQCRIPTVLFDRKLSAILADLEPLSLPSDVVGMVGLTFLRQFRGWGGERGLQGKWRFFLST